MVNSSPGPLADQGRELLRQGIVDLVEHGPRLRERLGQGLAHPDRLTPLPWTDECACHGPMSPRKSHGTRTGRAGCQRSRQDRQPERRVQGVETPDPVMRSLALSEVCRLEEPPHERYSNASAGALGAPWDPFSGTSAISTDDACSERCSRPSSPACSSSTSRRCSVSAAAASTASSIAAGTRISSPGVTIGNRCRTGPAKPTGRTFRSFPSASTSCGTSSRRRPSSICPPPSTRSCSFSRAGCCSGSSAARPRPRHAAMGVLAFAFFPVSFYFFSPYTEALFLFLTLLGIDLLQRGHFVRAGLAAALLSATRNQGAFFAVVILAYGLDAYRAKAAQPRSDAHQARPRRRAGVPPRAGRGGRVLGLPVLARRRRPRLRAHPGGPGAATS